MARFLMSPGVLTREVDASQYTLTTSANGNNVALVGYAEKGPFDPVIVSSEQDFEETFGVTLAESPYLAMTAYKIFDEGGSCLIVRAGDSRDPDSVPTAAKYASKEIRVVGAGTGEPATTGYQEFNYTESFLPAGSFTSGMNYSFKLTADNRAFRSEKIVEKWTGSVMETYNGLAGTGSFPAELKSIMKNVVAKIAYDSSTSNSFTVNYKSLNDISDSVGEYSGSGTRTGTTYGSSVSSSIVRYRTNNTYAVVSDDTLNLNLSYRAVALGNKDLTSGLIVSNGTEVQFIVRLSTDNVTFTVNTTVAGIDELVTNLNGQRSVDVASRIEFFKYTVDGGATNFIAVRKIGTVDETITVISAVVTATVVDGAVEFGITPKEYKNEDFLFGTWTATAPIDSEVYEFAGSVILKKVETKSGQRTFEEPAEISVMSPLVGKWDKTAIVDQISEALLGAYPAYINGASARAVASIVNGKIRISTIGPNTTTTKSFVKIETPSGTDISTILGGVATAVDGLDETEAPGDSVINLIAKEKGSYGNKLSLKVESGTKKISMTQTAPVNNVYVLYDGKEVSSYIGVYWGDGTAKDSSGKLIGAEAEIASSNYILTKMADDAYISIDAYDEDDNSTMGRLPSGTWTLGNGDLPSGVTVEQAEVINFVKGTNGWIEDSTGAITSFSDDLIAALEKIENPEVFNFNLVAAPGGADPIVQGAVQDLASTRKDCFGVVDAAPFGLGLGIRNGTTHISEVNNACTTLTSSYVGAYWPWLQDYDSDNKQYVWLPPSTFALKQIVYTDNVSDPWQAPAGNKRGVVDAVDIEYSPSNADRDTLYGDGNIVNPIVKFINEGITIWGQKTAQRTSSAVDRINVRRLMIYAERLIASMARTFLFEPNDETNWASFARQANAILEPIRQRRGLYQYTVVCDSTTNTSDLINQNIMSGKIFLQPMKTIEFIEVSFTINAATGDTTIEE